MKALLRDTGCGELGRHQSRRPVHRDRSGVPGRLRFRHPDPDRRRFHRERHSRARCPASSQRYRVMGYPHPVTSQGEPSSSRSTSAMPRPAPTTGGSSGAATRRSEGAGDDARGGHRGDQGLRTAGPGRRRVSRPASSGRFMPKDDGKPALPGAATPTSRSRAPSRTARSCGGPRTS